MPYGSLKSQTLLCRQQSTLHPCFQLNSGVWRKRGGLFVQVRVWDTGMLVCLKTLQGHSGAVRALAASPTRVFSGSDDTTIKVPLAFSRGCERLRFPRS